MSEQGATPVEHEVIHVQEPTGNAVDFVTHIMKEAEKRDKLLDKIKEVALRATHSGDWADQSGNPYLMGSGAEKVMRRFGLRAWGFVCTQHREEDTKGEYYWFEYTGYFGFSEFECIPAIGTCSSRDQFFSTIGGEDKPQAEVDKTNIMKSAYTNLVVNGVTRFLGLRNMTWEELKNYGVDQSKAATVKRKSRSKAAEWNPKQAERAGWIGDWMVAQCGGDKGAAATQLYEATSWTDKQGKEVKGKRTLKELSGKQVDILYRNNKASIDEFNDQTGASQNGEKADEPTPDPKSTNSGGQEPKG